MRDAVNDYVATNDTEITFKTGNVIFVPNVNDASAGEGKYKGVFGGKVGSFPKVYVKDTSVKIEPGGGTTRVKASFAHEATEESGELSFPKDAVMFVVAKVSETHWKGVWDGKAGLIPVALVHDATAPPKPEEMKLAGMRCMAKQSVVGEAEGSLSFKCGDIIFVPVPTPDATEWKGVSGGVVGTFAPDLVMDTAGKSKEELEAVKEAKSAEPEEQAALAAFTDWKAQRDALLNQ